MPDRRTPTAAERSQALVRDAATAAVELALSGHEKATEAAVSRAIRDERVERDLKEHQRRLDAINGSQERTAKALGEIRTDVAALAEASTRHAAVAEALARSNQEQAKVNQEQNAGRFSKHMKVIAAVGVVAAWVSIIVAIALH